MIRRAVSFIVISILTVHLAGIYVFSIVRLGEIRMEQRYRLATLPDDQLDIIQVPDNQFRTHWMEEREMKWQGRMYDIARVVRNGPIVLVYALHDEDEDNLLSFLSAVVQSSQEDTQSAPSSLVQFFTLEFITSAVLIPQPESATIAGMGQVAAFVLLNTSFDPSYPPPRV